MNNKNKAKIKTRLPHIFWGMLGYRDHKYQCIDHSLDHSFQKQRQQHTLLDKLDRKVVEEVDNKHHKHHYTLNSLGHSCLR